jgi:uncharacterized repeat protein (TIGR01451 family)
VPFDLSLTKTQTNTGGLSTWLVRAWQLIAYQLTLRSVFGLATNIKVQDVLPLGFTYVSHSASTGTYTTGSGLWNVINIASGATATLTITGTINKTWTILNTAAFFSFSGTDQSGANNTGTVSITGVLTPPTSVNDSGTMREDGSWVIAVLQNDIAGSWAQTLSITGVTSPVHGTVSIVGTGILYTPSANFCGTDTFTYKAKNQFGEVSVVAATVTVIITCVNDAPQIIQNGIGDKTDENQPIYFHMISPSEHAINYVSNTMTYTDAFPGNYIVDAEQLPDMLTLHAFTQPTNGVVVWSGLDFTYTPHTGYCHQDHVWWWNDPAGSDHMEYSVVDASGAVSNTGEMNFTVLCMDSNPVAIQDINTGEEDTQVLGDVSLNDLAPDLFYNAQAYLAEYVVDSQPSHGTLNFDHHNGQYEYTPYQDRCGDAPLWQVCQNDVIVITHAIANGENFMSFEDVVQGVSYVQGIHLWDESGIDAFIANDPNLQSQFVYAYNVVTDTATFRYIGWGNASDRRITTDLWGIVTYQFTSFCTNGSGLWQPTDTNSPHGVVTHFYGIEDMAHGQYYPVDPGNTSHGYDLQDEISIDAYIAAEPLLAQNVTYSYDAIAGVWVIDYIGGWSFADWSIRIGDAVTYFDKKALDWLYSGSLLTWGGVWSWWTSSDYFTYHLVDGRWFTSLTTTVALPIACVNDLPVITLVGNDPETVLLHTTYTDAGATATDVEDGDITTGIVMSGVVDTNAVGSYTLTYDVVDSQSWAALQVTRTVHVVTGSLPTISLIGSSVYSQPALVGYTESGATYSDLEDGTGYVSNISGIVSTNTLGTYLITYDYTDTQGNIATQATRSVTITAPICDLGRESNISTGNVATCAPCQPGSANATTWWSCLQCVPGMFASNAGSLTCSACPTGLSSTTGAVSCADTTPPVVTLQGSGTIVVLLNTSFIDPGAKWVDVIDGSGVANMSGSVNISVTGSYIITYTYTDAAGNTGNTVARTVIVTEGNMPVISLNDSPVLTLEVLSSYMESGAVYSDTEDGTGIVVNLSWTVNTWVVGTYTITYDYTDAQGNVAVQVSRIVHVVDTTKPVISLVGSGDITVLIHNPHTDAGATATDNYDGNLTLNIAMSGTVNTWVVGTYTITYDVTDAHSNVATQVTRTVHVVAGWLPTISLIGSGVYSLPALVGYIELGAMYSDLEDGSGAVSNVSWFVLTNTLGTYLITYNYTDMQWNIASQVTRTVTIAAPVCEPGRESNISTGNVASCILCPAGSANAMTGGSCVQCAAGTFTDVIASLSCTSCPIGMTSTTGAMSCSDTISPVVTLSGLFSVSLLQGTTYIEHGAFWTDGIDGSGVILSPFSGTVNTNIAGTYTLLYRYIDNAGNTGNVVTRIVSVTQSVIPQQPQSTGVAFGWGGWGSSSHGGNPTASVVSSNTVLTPTDTETFNPTITGLCYQRDSMLQLTGRSILPVHKDFPAALRFLASYELTKYTAIDTYRPFDSLTREEASKLFTQYARNVLCRQPNTNTINYSDIASADQTLVPYITLAYQLTLMHGDAVGTFRPLDTLSKPEFLAVLVRMMLYNYLDETSPQWYASYEQVGKDLAIITQDIDPLAKGVSRHDAALMLFRAYRYQEYGVFDKWYDTYILKNYEGVVQKYK